MGSLSPVRMEPVARTMASKAGMKMGKRMGEKEFAVAAADR